MPNKVMFYIVIIAVLASCSVQVSAQYGPGKVIAEYPTYGEFFCPDVMTSPVALAIEDVDQDTDEDVLFARRTTRCDTASHAVESIISWFEALDAAPHFASERIIVADTFHFSTVGWLDADDDGDLDVAAAFWDGQENRLRLYENCGRPVTLALGPRLTTTYRVGALGAADLDNDGDTDLVVGSGPLATWYPGLSGRIDFGGGRGIGLTDSNNRITQVISADLDKDGFLDVLTGNHYGRQAIWWRNVQGGQYFSREDVSPKLASDGRVAIDVSDIDGDGDLDVMVASSSSVLGDPHHEDRVAWYENSDGSGNFVEHLVSESSQGATSAVAGDIDMDGDPDLAQASWGDGQLVWYENTDGCGDFAQAKIISTDVDCASELALTDLDGDSDPEIVVVTDSFCGIFSIKTLDAARILSFDNLTLATSPKELDTPAAPRYQLSVYPLPVQSKATVVYTIPDFAPVTLRLYNVLGKSLRSVFEGNRTPGTYEVTHDASGLSSGVYIYRLQAGEYAETRRMVVVR